MPLKAQGCDRQRGGRCVQGTRLEGYLNGKRLLDYVLPEAVTGKVGVWSKTDSVSLFDDFTVAAQ